MDSHGTLEILLPPDVPDVAPAQGGVTRARPLAPEPERSHRTMADERRRVSLLQRAVGLAVLALAAFAAAVLWVTVGASIPVDAGEPTHATLFGLWDVVYDAQMPPRLVVLAAVALAVALAAGVALLDRRIADRSRRSANLVSDPLAPRNVMAGNRGVHAGPVTVTVLIPAHDEAASLPATIDSLLLQSCRPDRVIVVADNCTDTTVAVARAAGVEVFETVGNTDKKAGALNQALRHVLPAQGDNDAIMIMDADTRLDDGFLAAAVARMTADRALLAVGGVFYGEGGSGLIGQFQRNEYIRYSREVHRRRGRVFVLTGTASLFRPIALRTVAENRGALIPGTPGNVYDTAALTEDNELTFALKSLGALMVSPPQCTVVTEVMPTWRALWAQRLRWQRGALENLGAYGPTPRTFRYWAQQLAIGYGVIALASYFLLLALTMLTASGWVWFPFWMGIGVVFVAERVVTVWNGGWRARLLALMLVPELLFDAFLDLAYLKGIIDISVGRQASWKHVVRAPGAPAVLARTVDAAAVA